MTDFLHIRRVQPVGYGGDNPIPFSHVRVLIKERSIAQGSLLRGKASNALCYCTAVDKVKYLLRSLVGGTENDGDAWVFKSTLVPKTAKVTSIPGNLELVVCYSSSFRIRLRG